MLHWLILGSWEMCVTMYVNLPRERGDKNRTIRTTKYQLNYFAVLKIKE